MEISQLGLRKLRARHLLGWTGARADALIARFQKEPRVDKKEAELAYWTGLIAELTTGCADANARHEALMKVCHEITFPRYCKDLYLQEDSFEGQRILDLGCGPHAGIIGFKGCERHGADHLLSGYKSIGYPLDDHPITYVESKSEGLPYQDQSFDCVICVNALDHVDDLFLTMSEIARIVKPGGRFIGQFNFHDEPTDCEPIVLSHDDIMTFFCKNGFECERVVFQYRPENLHEDRYFYSFRKTATNLPSTADEP